jgi:nitrogen permease regulator 2-like protein
MPSDGDSFLPRIQSVFYAVFDLRQGPKIVYQVPEGLIAVSNSGGVVGCTSLSSSSSPAPSTPNGDVEGTTSRNSSSSLRSPGRERSMQSPQKRSTSSNRTLFNFDDISSYVIPRSALYGRLVICATRNHRIIGFPVELRGDYERNYFRYNLCFVFERTADLSCYEPIVRKVSRVLTACEVHNFFYWPVINIPTDRPRKNPHFCLHQRLHLQYIQSWNNCMKTLTRIPKHLSPSTNSIPWS